MEIPRDKLVVFTGLSGSGKSSLAFDTIYAEGQRRYVESLSAYARQFLGQMDKPDVDSIEGLVAGHLHRPEDDQPQSPLHGGHGDGDLRLLAAVVRPHRQSPLPQMRPAEIAQQTVEQMVDQLMAWPKRTRLQILAPLVRGRKGEHKKLLEESRREGFVRVRVDGEMREVAEPIELDKNKKHTIEVVVDRIVVQRRRGRAGWPIPLETALRRADGRIVARGRRRTSEELLFSEKLACPDCGISIEELSPRMFSFNSPYGACPECDGLGVRMDIDPELVMPDKNLSLREGGIRPWAGSQSQLLPAIAGGGVPALRHRHGRADGPSCPKSSSRCCCTARRTRKSRSDTQTPGRADA